MQPRARNASRRRRHGTALRSVSRAPARLPPPPLPLQPPPSPPLPQIRTPARSTLFSEIRAPPSASECGDARETAAASTSDWTEGAWFQNPLSMLAKVTPLSHPDLY
ncbi:hypothetical protein U9M48_037702 [Paspalum notatum var. saurae]|uniref:Uncharacterized protein n=1 Tax=Paspalum notatum var. saurae TaxID=547442 RepID=A0AAQ3UKD7_PASNO